MSKDGSYRIYLLAVCFVSIVCAAITSGVAIYSFLKIVAPQLTLDTHSFEAHQSLDHYKKSHFYSATAYPHTVFVPGALGVARPMRQSGAIGNFQPEPGQEPLSDDDIERLRLESYGSLITSHKRGAMQELIRLSIVLLVSSVLFFAHWQLLNKNGDPP